MNFIMTVIIFVMVAQTTTIIHELGHAIPALIFTKDKVKITLGSKDVIGVFSLGRLDIYIKKFNPIAGFVHSNKSSLSKPALFLISFGGPAFSCITIILLIFIRNDALNRYTFQALDFAVNYCIISFIITAVPVIYPKFFGVYSGQPSDGYRMLMLLKKNSN